MFEQRANNQEVWVFIVVLLLFALLGVYSWTNRVRLRGLLRNFIPLKFNKYLDIEVSESGFYNIIIHLLGAFICALPLCSMQLPTFFPAIKSTLFIYFIWVFIGLLAIGLQSFLYFFIINLLDSKLLSDQIQNVITLYSYISYVIILFFFSFYYFTPYQNSMPYFGLGLVLSLVIIIILRMNKILTTWIFQTQFSQVFIILYFCALELLPVIVMSKFIIALV